VRIQQVLPRVLQRARQLVQSRPPLLTISLYAMLISGSVVMNRSLVMLRGLISDKLEWFRSLFFTRCRPPLGTPLLFSATLALWSSNDARESRAIPCFAKHGPP
jgi:hypothetical protein